MKATRVLLEDHAHRVRLYAALMRERYNVASLNSEKHRPKVYQQHTTTQPQKGRNGL
jgi:hypothetical protein